MPTEVPPYSLPAHNRQVLLVRRPAGIPEPDDFILSASVRPALGRGQILVRNIYLSVDPAQRGWASAEANYTAPAALGLPMRALAVGIVIESKSSEYRAGEFVYGWFGWQDFAAVDPAQIILRARHDVPLSAFASLLGVNGVGAYLALSQLGRPQAGETLVVSTAAGSVGSIAGQLGRLMGCRAIGLTGDDAKVARCVEKYGYEKALNYKSANWPAALAEACPLGVNIYFDNTGGAILDNVLRRMALRGRVVQCGTSAVESWSPPPNGPRNEREILTRRLVWSGFVLLDHLARYPAAAEELARLYAKGALVYDIDISEGIEQAPNAIAALYAGKNKGKKLIYVG